MFMERVRDCAAFTVASILPPAEVRSTRDRLPESYQSLGYMGVKNIQGRLLLSLFPVGMPWFTFAPPPALLRDPGMTNDVITEIQSALYTRELIIQSQLDRTNYRKQMRLNLEQMIVTGNCLFQVLDSYEIKSYRFDQYVCKRYSDGDLRYIIIHEMIDPLTLSDEERAAADLTLRTDDGSDDEVAIYTKAEVDREAGTWQIEQEVNETVIRTSTETVSPFVVGRYDELLGEHYGRGLCEMILGDLRSYEGLSKGILDIGIAASRLIGVVDNQQGTTRMRDITDIPNGQFIAGSVRSGVAQDVAFLQANKTSDYSVARNHAADVAARLNKAFINEGETQPTGERVTATQIMRLAQHTDSTLGDVFAAVSEIQAPFVRRVVHQMERDLLLGAVDSQLIDTKIVTGLEALRRGQDLNKLIGALQVIQQVPELAQRIDPETLLHRLITLTGIDPVGLIKSGEQMDAQRQQQIAQNVQEAAGRKAIDVVGNIAEQRDAA